MSKTYGPLTNVLDPEELVGCPYNETHRISRAKRQIHLVKCRKANPNAKKVACLYNSTHIINEQEVDCHHEECPDRGNLDAFKYVPAIVTPVTQPLPEPYIPPPEENWDDVSCGTYEPAKKMSENPLINSHYVVTKSEKKKIKHREREKFRHLDGEHPIKTPSPLYQSQDLLTDKPLNAPKSISMAVQMSSKHDPSTSKHDPSTSKHYPSTSKYDPSSTSSDKLSSNLANLGLGAKPKQIPENDDGFVVVRKKGR